MVSAEGRVGLDLSPAPREARRAAGGRGRVAVLSLGTRAEVS